MCQKAFFTFKYTQQEQEGIISGIDVRDRPEGHVVVTKEEQNAVLKPHYQRDLEIKTKKSSVKPQSALFGSVMVEDQDERAPDTPGVKSAKYKLEGVDNYHLSKPLSSARVSLDGQSDISLLPPQNIEKHQHEIENLKWQIQYEKKLHNEMG